MKQRLLLALLALMTAVGSVGIASAATIKATSNGTKAVVLTFDKAVSNPTASSANVTLSDDKQTVTISQGYTTAVDITVNNAASITVNGNLSALKVEGNVLTSISFGSDNYVKDLKLSSTSLETLICSGMGMQSLDLAGATKLKTLDASNNQLSSITLPTPNPQLEDVNLSNNNLATFNAGSLTALTRLNVENNQLTESSLTGLGSLRNLTTLQVSGNRIKQLTGLPSGLVPDYGTQTIELSSVGTTYGTEANKGFRIPKLLKDAGITTTETTDYSAVSWQVLKNNAYQEDNGQTVHQMDGAWADEYRFFDAVTNEFVSGDYQCTVTTGGRTYILTGLKVWLAKFDLQGEKPAHADKFEVSVDGATAVDVSTHPLVKQGQKLVFTVKPSAGYESVTYKIEGMVPANASQQEPYTGTSFESIVKGKFVNAGTSVVPKISAVVSGKEHNVVYKDNVQTGGSFTVEKISGTTTSAIESNGLIASGDELLVKIKPQTGYDFKLTINGTDKTANVTQTGNGTDYTFREKVSGPFYADKQTITITVTFTNAALKAFVKVDGKTLSAANTPYVENNKVTIQSANGTKQDITDNHSVSLEPNTTHQAIFTLKEESSVVYRLKDLTINGGKLESINQDAKTGNAMQYTATFSVETAEITISITTKPMEVVNIVASNQTQVYDGNAKPVLFETNPKNLNNQVEVSYKTDATPSLDLGKKAPTGVGKYKATLKYIEQKDGSYIGGSSKTVDLEILKAPLTIKELPTVTINRAAQYEITGGSVYFGEKEVKGSFAANPTTPGANVGKSHTVKVKFTPAAQADKDNFETAEATVNVLVDGSDLDLYTVSMAEMPSEDYSIEWFNGNMPVDLASASFANGTTLTAVVTYPKGTKDVNLVATSQAAGITVTKDATKSVDGRDVYTVTLSRNAEFKVQAGTALKYTIKISDQSKDYTGNPQAYDPATKGLIISDANNQTVQWSSIQNKVSITYEGVEGKPVDAGVYTVVVTIKADPANGYVESVAAKAAFTINKVKATVYKWPVASVIAKGQTLAFSELTGGASNIDGKFEWKNNTVSYDAAGEYRQPVVFTPSESYQKNYLSVETRDGEDFSGTGVDDRRVLVRVSDMQMLTYAPKDGTMTVINQRNETLPTGSAITEGDVLSITAVPRTGFVLKSLLANGVPCGTTYTVGSTSVALEAIFEVEQKDPEIVIDPNSQYAVTLPKQYAVRGVVVNKPGVNAVKKGDPFSFSVNTLAADAEKVVVKANGLAIVPTNGIYTIESVNENTEISVSLPNPTALKVSIETETKNKNGHLLGTVQVEGPTDGYCYYGDALTLVAFPESGVTFEGWSDDKTAKDRLRTLTLTKDITIKPLFSGSPTGVESIESLNVYGSTGCIVFRGIGEARATVVSMDGRASRHELNGDSRVAVPAGIYGVILEQGNETKRMKVVVR